jgi:hypothetical protein
MMRASVSRLVRIVAELSPGATPVHMGEAARPHGEGQHLVSKALSEKQVLNERGSSKDEHDNHEQQNGGKLPGPDDIGVVQRHLRDHVLSSLGSTSLAGVSG